MAILLLCQGNDNAKAILRNAIIAHYGPHPIGYESVKMIASGRVKQSVGKFNLWFSLKLDTYFLFPHQFRQDYKIHWWYLPLLKKSEAFDGTQHYQKNGSKPAIVTAPPAKYLNQVALRLHAFTSMLLLPLNDTDVEITYINDYCIQATHVTAKTTTQLYLYENFQLRKIVTTIEDANSEFRLDLSEDVIQTETVKTFTWIKVYWNGIFKYELYPLDIQFGDILSDEMFVLN